MHHRITAEVGYLSSERLFYANERQEKRALYTMAQIFKTAASISISILLAYHY
jgi:hypothetical protein